MTEDEMVGQHHQLNGHESEQAPGYGEGGLVCCSLWGHKESDMTKQLNTTTTEIYSPRVLEIRRLAWFSGINQGVGEAVPLPGILGENLSLTFSTFWELLAFLGL